MTSKYKVWDKINESEECAHTIEDCAPEYAAEQYAHDDIHIFHDRVLCAAVTLPDGHRTSVCVC